MGQAKARGNFEERKAKAIVRNEEQLRLEAIAYEERLKNRVEYRNQRNSVRRRTKRNKMLLPAIIAATMGIR